MTNLLALDQSTRTTGYAIFQNNKLIKVDKFTLIDPLIEVRLNQFRNKIKNVIKEYDITEIVLEEIQLQDNVTTFKKLAMVYGVLLELIVEMNIPYEIISSNTWKSRCGIRKTRRAEEKKAAQRFVKDNYNLSVTEDESDAICIGYTYLKDIDNYTDDLIWSF